ncbi:hypothetical protein [Microbacterium sp. 2MCAF23]|uniref:hypothetical protein n=1 Tax=Microbacterium sp. 2MCAF23 TaxID=3232985 RepID=UPI003F97AA78
MNGARRQVDRRLLRRELRAARTGPAVVVAVVLLLAALVTIAVSFWTADSWGASVFQNGAATVRAAWGEPSWRAAIGAAAGIVGIALIVLALVPGRRRRHGRTTGRVELVVDDGLLADVAAQAVAARCQLPTTQVSATMTAKRVRVRIRPVSGVPVDTAGAADAAQQALAHLGFAVRSDVTVATKGVIA